MRSLCPSPRAFLGLIDAAKVSSKGSLHQFIPQPAADDRICLSISSFTLEIINIFEIINWIRNKGQFVSHSINSSPIVRIFVYLGNRRLEIQIFYNAQWTCPCLI